MNPDPEPAIFVIDIQDANKKLIFFNKFFWLLIEGTVHLVINIIFQRLKVKKKEQNSRNQGFSYYFWLKI
jgi:hypothetical protein